jgi:iron complex outermembrane receptor protein
MFRKSKVCTGVLVALGGALLVSSMPALAQSAERVEITGSLIKRLASETAVPIATLRAEDLVKAGATNAEQVVALIVQQQGGTVTSSSVSGTNGAAAYASLRNLGASRTLVLINGKRMVTNPFSSAAVDLNSIPVAAIDRVETLADGASAVYGTDAVAGVINFVMKKSYSGVAIDAAVTKTQEGGGDVNTANLVAGFGDMAKQGFNVYGAINFRDQKPLGGAERDFMRTSFQPERGFNGLSPTAFPANYSQGTIIGNPAAATGCIPPLSISIPENASNVYTPDGSGTLRRCFADTQAITKVIPIQEQTGILLKGSLALGANHTLSAEYIQTKNTVESQIAPSPEGGLTVTPTSPFYPGNGIYPADPRLDNTQNINVNWRTVVLGARRGMQENDTKRAVLAVEGNLGDWYYQASALNSTSEVVNTFLGGWPRTQALRDGVAGDGRNGAPALNPFGDQTAAGLAYMQANSITGPVQDGKGTVNSLNASIAGSIFKLPAGDVQFAANLEQRDEDNVYNTDVPKVSQAASSGLAGSGARRGGERDVTAVSFEVIVPILKSLEISGSLRQDKYSDFGSTTNPKVAFRFQPSEMFLLRGSYNTGFSAPTLTNLYSPQSTTFTANRYNDPVLCPGGVVNTAAGGRADRDCGIQFQRLQGGNPNLQAEKSKAWTVGFAVQPIPSVTASVDFWNYYIEDNISTAGEQAIFGDFAKYSNLFIRCSQASAALQNSIGACQNRGTADPLAYIVDALNNLGDTKTQGVDVQLTWTGAPTSVGRFSASLNGSYTHRYEFQLEPAGRWFNPVGNYNAQFGGPVIRYQQTIRVNWDTGNWALSLGNRYATGYRDQNATSAPFNVAPFNTNTVKPYSLFDASVSYKGIKGLTLGLGIQNLLDKDPPFTNQVARFQARAYDDRFHNPLGRAFRLSAKYEF